MLVMALLSTLYKPHRSRVLSLFNEEAEVKKEKLSDVVGNDKWEINNSLDEKYKSRPAHVIVREAEAKVGEEMKYSVILWNCEHFATEMRYGEAISRQVRKVGEAIVTILDGIESLISSSKEENN